MKVFSSLLDGIYYVSECPFCGHQMQISAQDASVNYMMDHNSLDMRTELVYSLNFSDTLTIVVETEEVEIVLKPKYLDINNSVAGGYNHGYMSPAKSYYPTYNGRMFLRLRIDCNACCRYSYIIGIEVIVEDNTGIDKVYLNSEMVSWEENTVVHEIRNSYASNETEYRIIGDKDKQGAETKSLVLPLISLDLSNLQNTVNRIKTLAIFS